MNIFTSYYKKTLKDGYKWSYFNRWRDFDIFGGRWSDNILDYSLYNFYVFHDVFFSKGTLMSFPIPVYISEMYNNAIESVDYYNFSKKIKNDNFIVGTKFYVKEDLQSNLLIFTSWSDVKSIEKNKSLTIRAINLFLSFYLTSALYLSSKYSLRFQSEMQLSLSSGSNLKFNLISNQNLSFIVNSNSYLKLNLNFISSFVLYGNAYAKLNTSKDVWYKYNYWNDTNNSWS